MTIPGASPTPNREEAAARRPRKNSRRRKPRKGWYDWAKDFILPIILALLASGGLLASWIGRSDSASATPTAAVQSERVPLQDEYYHIGDVEFTTVLQEGQVVDRIYFSHPAPQANPFTKDFELAGGPRSVTLHITARSIDPDEKTSPVKVFFNGQFFILLNRYFTRETMEETSASIPVDTALLHAGQNSFQIFVEPTSLDILPNLDDIEFWNLYLEVVY